MLIVITGPDNNQSIMERKLSDSGWDETVKAVAAGEWTDISSIIQTSTGTDVLPLIVGAAMDIWADSGEPREEWQDDLIDTAGGVRRIRRFALPVLEAAE